MSENKTTNRAEALATILKAAGYKVDSANAKGVKFDVVRMKKGVDMAAVLEVIKEPYPDASIHGQNVRLPKEGSPEQSAKPAPKKAGKAGKAGKSAKKAAPKKAAAKPAKKVAAKKAAAKKPAGKVKSADKKAANPIEKPVIEKVAIRRTRGKSIISKSDATEVPTDLLVQLVLGVYDQGTKKALIVRLAKEGMSPEDFKSLAREVLGGVTEDSDLSGMTAKQLKKILKSVPTEYLLGEIRVRTQPQDKA